MNRRDLFSNLVRMSSRDLSPVETMPVVLAGLTERTLPLTLEDVLHLYRRVGFSATMAQAKSLVGKTAVEVVDALLGSDTEPDHPSPGAWVDVATENPAGADLQTRNAIEASWYTYHALLSNWWLGHMKADTKAVEKLSLFWMSHWVSEFSFDAETVTLPQALYRQYKVLRKGRLGDMKQMALDVTVDNAMVWYLGGHFNESGKPNENYGRELLELFTTGIGWYTEGDVKEASRVLTGWKASRYSDEPSPNGIYNTWFAAAKHDTGAKQFMGQPIPARTADNNTEYQVKNEEVFELIKIIFEERPIELSRFIAEKFYRYFVYSSKGDVDVAFVAELATVFAASGFQLRALARALFTSERFFDQALRGVQIKTPFEFVVGVQRQLGLDAADPMSWMAKMDQNVMDPPNVAGWPGYRSWISTNTYPVRRQLTDLMIRQMTDAQAVTFIKQFDDHTDVRKFVRGVIAYLLPVSVSQAREDFYVSALMQSAPEYEWVNIIESASAAGQRLRTLITTISKAPDFQLC